MSSEEHKVVRTGQHYAVQRLSRYIDGLYDLEHMLCYQMGALALNANATIPPVYHIYIYVYM